MADGIVGFEPFFVNDFHPEARDLLRNVRLTGCLFIQGH